MAAAGHYGSKSPLLVKHYAEDLGYEYITANDKETFLKQMSKFVNPKINDRSMVFEIFTNRQDESDALEMVLNLIKPSVDQLAKKAIKKVIKKASSIVK